MKCAQIIGVTDSDTTVEIAIAKASVTENSRNRRPTMPPMNRSGMNAAISDTLIETTVKPIWRAPSMAARIGEWPFSRLRNVFSIMTMASSTTKPTDTASAISDRLSIEKPTTHIAAQVPASDSGTVTPAAIVGAVRRRKMNTTSITSIDRAGQRPLHVVDAGADGLGAVRQDGDVDVGRDPALDFREQLADAVDGVDDVGVDLLGDDQQHRRLQIVPGRGVGVARALHDRGDVGQADDVAVDDLDDQRAVVGARCAADRWSRWFRRTRAVEFAERALRIGARHRDAHVVERNARRGDTAPD